MEWIFPENIKDYYISKLWNYLLLESGLNKDCENKSFKEKLHYYNKSKYKVTKDMNSFYWESLWNPSTVEKLQSFYAEKAKDVWRLDF